MIDSVRKDGSRDSISCLLCLMMEESGMREVFGCKIHRISCGVSWTE